MKYIAWGMWTIFVGVLLFLFALFHMVQSDFSSTLWQGYPTWKGWKIHAWMRPPSSTQEMACLWENITEKTECLANTKTFQNP